MRDDSLRCRLSPHPDAIAAEVAAHNAKGPHILSDEVKANIEQPLVGLDHCPSDPLASWVYTSLQSREELRKRQEELNK